MTYFSKMPIDELIAEVSDYSQDWLAALDARDDDMMRAIESASLEALPRLLDEVERLRALFPRRCSTCKGTGRHKDPMWTSDRCGRCSGGGKASRGDEGLDPVEWSAGQWLTPSHPNTSTNWTR